MLTIPYPAIDPVLIQVGPLSVRWYALAYLAGLVIGWRYCLALAGRSPVFVKREDIDDFLLWATLGVILGGRLGYVLFYKPGDYFTHPIEIVEVWNGGMSFHGGALGTLTVIALFTWQRQLPLLKFADIIVCAVPIGLFFGRIANFINGELWGRVTDVPWAMVFPMGGPLPRHPSELYEAFLEGVVLFLLVNGFGYATRIRERPGALSGIFLVGYATARIAAEFFREPDAFLGFILPGITMGQILSIPLMALGLFLLLRAYWALPEQPAQQS